MLFKGRLLKIYKRREVSDWFLGWNINVTYSSACFSRHHQFSRAKKGDYKAGFFQEVAFGALVGEEKEK